MRIFVCPGVWKKENFLTRWTKESWRGKAAKTCTLVSKAAGPKFRWVAFCHRPSLIVVVKRSSSWGAKFIYKGCMPLGKYCVSVIYDMHWSWNLPSYYSLDRATQTRSLTQVPRLFMILLFTVLLTMCKIITLAILEFVLIVNQSVGGWTIHRPLGKLLTLQ